MLHLQIQTKGVHLSSDVVEDIHSIMTANEKDVSPFMKLMWEEQKHALQKQKVSRYHPMIILMDKFFDILNVRNTSEWKRKRKTFLMPFETVDDERFAFGIFQSGNNVLNAG